MPASPFQLFFSSPDQTALLAKRLGALLVSGDTLLLSGGIGAGKTHFARELIQSLQDQPEDVPSPTFTLVQTYDTASGEVWHSDLYRLNAVDEVIELGLLDAFETAICLVEWPDRLDDLAPSDALSLGFELGKGENERQLTLTWQNGNWDERLKDLIDE